MDFDKDQSQTFERLSVKNFRRLANVDLELRPLNVLIGANGIGKTSFLDVLSLMAQSAQGSLRSALSDLSGLAAILTYDRQPELQLKVSMNVKAHEPLEYSLRIRAQGNAYEISSEELSQRRTKAEQIPFKHIDSQGSYIRYFNTEKNKLLAPTWDHNPLETSLSQVPKMYQQPEEFRRRLASSTLYHALDVGARSPIRLPQPMRPAALPGKDGEDLVSCLFNLRETDHDRFGLIEDTLQAAFPGFERLDFPPVAAGTLAMTWRDRRFSKPMFMHQLSEGILRFLWLSTLLHAKDLPSVVLLDEPEVSLHPELLSLLAEMLRSAAHRSQIIVATHSDRLIRFLTPEEIVVVDSGEKGEAVPTRADTLDLTKWLGDYTLDQLWENGRLGGRA